MIRPATDKDVPDILSVIHQAFEQYRKSLDPPSGAHKETLDSVRDKLAHGGAAVAIEGTRVIGCCLWRREPAHLYVGRLAVLPEYRKAGTGSQLMEWMEHTARRLEAPRIQIMVRIALGGMKEFYERKGYVVTGQGSHEGCAVPTYVVMEKGILTTTADIRPCGGDDLDLIRQLSIETYDQTFRSMNTDENMDAYLEAAFSREKLQRELANEKSRFFLLHSDGAVCGYLKLNEAPAQSDLNDPDSLEIERIYVRKEFQGKGLGRTLVDHAIRLARQMGKQYIWLGVWEKNVDAVAFYGKMAFSVAGRHPFWMGEELQSDLIMKKMLSG